MTVDRTEERILILGGGGMVGLQVAREAARELQPSLIVLSAFFVWEARSRSPMLDVRLFGSRTFNAGTAASTAETSPWTFRW